MPGKPEHNRREVVARAAGYDACDPNPPQNKDLRNGHPVDVAHFAPRQNGDAEPLSAIDGLPRFRFDVPASEHQNKTVSPEASARHSHAAPLEASHLLYLAEALANLSPEVRRAVITLAEAAAQRVTNG